MKRAFDIAVSLLLLGLTSPLLLVAVIWIRADSPGPVFYRQTRVGRHGREFQMLKLRSMVSNADQIGGYATATGDPRITRSGHILRKTSLDELPQLLNVLIGDMSLVGPRPDVPQQKTLYDPVDWSRRLSVRPGITGLAQARLRSAATFQERLALDLTYVDNPSLPHDLAILVETAISIFRSRAT